MFFKKLLLPALLLFIFSSCQKEISVENGGILPGGGGNGGNGGSGSTANCKSCSYQPYCNGSTYTFVDSSIAGAPTTNTTTINIVADTIIDGRTYQKFTENGVSGYYNCTNGVASVMVFQAPPTSGGAPVRITTTLVKANEPVGATWVDNNINTLGQGFIYNSTIISKGGSRVVLGTTYNDVIHVRFTSEMQVPVLGTIVMSTTNSYFANNIGLIETNTKDETMGMMMMNRVLQSYHIP